MITQRQADINRNILAALRDFGVCKIEEITSFHGFIVLKPKYEELVAGVNLLKTYGHIEFPIAGDNEYFQNTEKGLRQLNRDGVKPDPAIWGRAAAQ